MDSIVNVRFRHPETAMGLLKQQAKDYLAALIATSARAKRAALPPVRVELECYGPDNAPAVQISWGGPTY